VSNLSSNIKMHNKFHLEY